MRIAFSTLPADGFNEALNKEEAGLRLISYAFIKNNPEALRNFKETGLFKPPQPLMRKRIINHEAQES